MGLGGKKSLTRGSYTNGVCRSTSTKQGRTGKHYGLARNGTMIWGRIAFIPGGRGILILIMQWRNDDFEDVLIRRRPEPGEGKQCCRSKGSILARMRIGCGGIEQGRLVDDRSDKRKSISTLVLIMIDVTRRGIWKEVSSRQALEGSVNWNLRSRVGI